MSQSRTIAAWALAISTFGIVAFVASIIGSKLGVPVVLDVEPYIIQHGRGVEDERSSITTAFGWGVYTIAVLAAVEVWHRAMGERLTSNGHATFMGTLLGGGILIVGGVPLWKLFHRSTGLISVVGNIIELGLFAVAVSLGIRLYRRLKANPSDTNS